MSAATENIEKNEKESTVSKLEFVPLKIPRLIPRELIEAVKDKTFTPEEFIAYQEKQIDNPYNHLFALIDQDKKIKGFLWAELNILDHSLFINTFSISKEFWGKGKGIHKAIEFLRTLKEKTGAPRAYWMTRNPRFYAKHGFSYSKNCLMEYNSN